MLQNNKRDNIQNFGILQSFPDKRPFLKDLDKEQLEDLIFYIFNEKYKKHITEDDVKKLVPYLISAKLQHVIKELKDSNENFSKDDFKKALKETFTQFSYDNLEKSFSTLAKAIYKNPNILDSEPGWIEKYFNWLIVLFTFDYVNLVRDRMERQKPIIDNYEIKVLKHHLVKNDTEFSNMGENNIKSINKTSIIKKNKNEKEWIKKENKVVDFSTITEHFATIKNPYKREIMTHIVVSFLVPTTKYRVLKDQEGKMSVISKKFEGQVNSYNDLLWNKKRRLDNFDQTQLDHAEELQKIEFARIIAGDFDGHLGNIMKAERKLYAIDFDRGTVDMKRFMTSEEEVNGKKWSEHKRKNEPLKDAANNTEGILDDYKDLYAKTRKKALNVISDKFKSKKNELFAHLEKAAQALEVPQEEFNEYIKAIKNNYQYMMDKYSERAAGVLQI